MFKISKRNKTIITTIIKMLIVGLALWYLYKQLFLNEESITLRQNLNSLTSSFGQYLLLSVVFLLMLANWGIESYKWQYLIKKIETISFLKAVEAILSGVTISLFTPNRVGEFGGRIFLLEKADHYKALLISIIGTYSKYIITLFVGSLSFALLPFFIKTDDMSSFIYFYYPIVCIVIAFNLLLFLLYFNPSALISVLRKFKALRKHKDYIELFNYYNTKELFNLLILSLLRYLIYSLQFYLLLRFFGIEISLIKGIMLISVTFFVSGLLPSIFFRLSIAVFFIGMISPEKELQIATSSFVLWIINIVIPSIIGAIFVFKFKFFRK